jgi:hypothetical protein
LKRVGSFLLAAILAILWCPVASAAATPTLSISSGEVSAGSSVTLTVSIADNPGLAATLIYIYYDTSVFTVSPDRDVAAAGSFRSSGGLIGNTIATARTNGRYDGDDGKDGVLALWYNGSGLNTTASGSMLTVTLHANAEAANGDYTVEAGYSASNTCDASGQKITLRTSVSTVTVTGGAQAATGSQSGSQNTSQNANQNGSQNGSQSGSQNAEQNASQTTTGSQSGSQNGGQDASAEPLPGDSGASAPNGSGTATDSGSQSNESANETADQTADETGETATAVLFSDVSGNWAESYIEKAASLGLVEGYNGLYRPNDSMTRAELVTILWRASGSPAPTADASFTDLTQTWYLDAVAWAEETGVVNGVGHGWFSPDGEVTREQLVTILHRLAGTPTGMEALLTGVYDSQYSDSSEVSTWAKAALYWSIYSEIYCGEASTSVGQTLAPAAAASRAQIAVMMVRYLENN